MMSIKRIYFLSVIMLLFCGFIPEKLIRVKLTDDIKVLLPEDFRPMNEETVKASYLSPIQPVSIYTSPDGQADFGLSIKNTGWHADDIALLKDFYQANILHLFDEVTFVKQEIGTINKRTFAVFEFVSKVSDQENKSLRPITRYTYIQYTVYKNKMMVFQFSCPAALKSRWEGTAKKIMESIKIK